MFNLLRKLPDKQNGVEKFDIHKVEKQASELEKDLIVKERETLEVLKELEAAKRIVEGLKMKLIKEVSELMSTFNFCSDSPVSIPNIEKPKGSLSMCPHVSSPNLILMELNEAKLNLNKTTNDLSAIQATVEILTNKMAKSKSMHGKISNCGRVLSVEENQQTARRDELQTAYDVETKYVLDNSMNNASTLHEIQQYNFEAEQFKKLEEAATYEVMKATSEIEQTKSSIKMVEMRLTAAKKIEEAARAMEAVALAKRNASKSISEEVILVHHPKPEGIPLSYEDYSCLTQKAQKAEEFSRNKHIDTTTSSISKLAITEDVKGSKKYQKDAFCKIDRTNRRKLSAEEDIFCRGRPEHGAMRYSARTATEFRYRNSHSYHSHRDDDHSGDQLTDRNESNHINDKPMPVLKSTISIGDILSRKLILPDDIMVGKPIEEGNRGRRGMSLSQMLRDQSGLILHPPKSAKSASVEKQFFAQRKKFGFIHVSLPLTKHGKKI